MKIDKLKLLHVVVLVSAFSAISVFAMEDDLLEISTPMKAMQVSNAHEAGSSEDFDMDTAVNIVIDLENRGIKLGAICEKLNCTAPEMTAIKKRTCNSKIEKRFITKFNEIAKSEVILGKPLHKLALLFLNMGHDDVGPIAGLTAIDEKQTVSVIGSPVPPEVKGEK